MKLRGISKGLENNIRAKVLDIVRYIKDRGIDDNQRIIDIVFVSYVEFMRRYADHMFYEHFSYIDENVRGRYLNDIVENYDKYCVEFERYIEVGEYLELSKADLEIIDWVIRCIDIKKYIRHMYLFDDVLEITQSELLYSFGYTHDSVDECVERSDEYYRLANMMQAQKDEWDV
jgi:nitrate reductase assembly molybdenum cofactor insertion protein NarJ